MSCSLGHGGAAGCVFYVLAPPTDVQSELYADGNVCARPVTSQRVGSHPICRSRHSKSTGTFGWKDGWMDGCAVSAVYVPACVSACVPVCLSHTHTHKQTHTQTYIHTNKHTQTQDAVKQFNVLGLPGVQCYKEAKCVQNTVYATSHEVLASLKTHGGEPPAPKRLLPGWMVTVLQTAAVWLLWICEQCHVRNTTQATRIHTQPHTGGCCGSCWVVVV